MKRFLKEYFSYSTNEKKGVLLLLIVIIALMGFVFFYDSLFPAPQQDFSLLDKQLSMLESNKTDSLKRPVFDHEDAVVTATESKFPTKQEPFAPFNPNTTTEKEWEKLGLSKKQIRVIENYKAKGGRFKQKTDLKKIYGISDRLYAQLEPYIVFATEVKVAEKHVEKTSPDLVELNTADTTQVKKLKGIGSIFAKRIIAYRNLLGGFYKKEQLLEVFGMDEQKYHALENQVSLDVTIINRININSATIDDLKKHPYLKYKLATLIINYREKHGAYKQVADVKKIELINEELYSRLENYLDIN